MRFKKISTSIGGLLAGALLIICTGWISIAPTPSGAATSPVQLSPSAPTGVIGQWNVTYGAPTKVAIWQTGPGNYQIIAVDPIKVTGSSCFLPVGTTLATFSGSGTSFSGLHNLYYTSNCSLGGQTSLALTLTGNTLTGVLGGGTYGTVTFTRILAPSPSLRSVGLLTFTYYAVNTDPKTKIVTVVPRVRGCTATVVSSPNRSTIVTAGHCMNGQVFGGGNDHVTNIQFAPSHVGACWANPQSGSSPQIEVSQCGGNPYGVWYANPANVYTDFFNNAQDDYAFIVLAPDPVNGPVADVVGGFPISFDPNNGGTSDPEDSQDWLISAYSADTYSFPGNTPQFGPFQCITTGHYNAGTGLLGEGLPPKCATINPLTGAETSFAMPSSGMPTGSSGSPWTNGNNSGTGAITIGAILTERYSSGIVGGAVLGSTAKQLFTTAGKASPPSIVPIQQQYSCPTFGSETVTLSGNVSRSNQTFTLSNLSFLVTDPLTNSASLATGVVSVPDPNKTSAPYVPGSAKLETNAPGWSAGHDSLGVYAQFSSSTPGLGFMVLGTLGSGDTISSPPISASYKIVGPKGTVITWDPGSIVLTLAAPVKGSFTCTAVAPVVAIASLAE